MEEGDFRKTVGGFYMKVVRYRWENNKVIPEKIEIYKDNKLYTTVSSWQEGYEYIDASNKKK